MKKFKWAVVTAFFLGFAPLCLKAQENSIINYEYSEKSLVIDVLEDFSSKNKIKLIYAKQDLNGLQTGPVKCISITKENCLKEIFKDTRLEYQLENNVLSVRKKREQKKSGKITGTVFDENGFGLSDAEIIISEQEVKSYSDQDGKFEIEVPEGSYNVKVNVPGYKPYQVTSVLVSENRKANIYIDMQTSAGVFNAIGLDDVVIVKHRSRETISGLLQEQKNSATVTDGISSEQINRLPDSNVGQVLRRISGVTTVNNKQVVVRGLTERYNQAMVDGIVLPSTSFSKRQFDFNVVPQEIVSSIVVNKTATPDLSAEFSGAQVIINTLSIPHADFNTVTIGTGGNFNSLGKDYYRLGERGKSDYFGFDDGTRKVVPNLTPWYWHNQVVMPPGYGPDDVLLNPGAEGPAYNSFDAIEQSKQISNSNLKLHKSRFSPNSNFRLGMGRVFHLKNNVKFGFTTGLSLRNQSELVEFNNIRGSNNPYINQIEELEDKRMAGPGHQYRSTSALGGSLNLGIRGNYFEITLKNMYTSMLEDVFTQSERLYYRDETLGFFKEMFEDPTQTGVWQSKLEASILPDENMKIDFYVAFSDVRQDVLDQRRLRYGEVLGLGYILPSAYWPGDAGNDVTRDDYRLWSNVKENAWNWGGAVKRDFLKDSDFELSFKTGYQGIARNRMMGVTSLKPTQATASGTFGTYDIMLDPSNMGVGYGQMYYYVDFIGGGKMFEGTMDISAYYAMVDQKIFNKLRLIYGVRAEYYSLAKDEEELLRKRYSNGIPSYMRAGEKDDEWTYLPSANLIYAITPKTNFRVSYSKTALRPDMRELSIFGFYDPELDANISGRGLKSTIVDNYDVRLEWYPSSSEVISLSGYYKYLDKPIELVINSDLAHTGARYFAFQNQVSAKNYGVELDFRKNFSFLGEQQWLKDLFINGNGTIIRSEVEALSYPDLIPFLDENGEPVVDENGEPTYYFHQDKLPGEKRPLYGQTPWIINAGIAYLGEKWGATLNYNRTGYRVNSISGSGVVQTEYELGVNMLDFQLYGKFLNQKMEVKFNLTNILDEWRLFYQNMKASLDNEGNHHPGQYVNGTANYEEEKGDIITYRSRSGRGFSLSVSYKF